MKLKKILRFILLTLLIILALAGMPVVIPKKIDQDNDDEVKTEIVEGAEQKD